MQMRKVNHEKDYYYSTSVKLLDDKVFGLHHEFKHVKFLKNKGKGVLCALWSCTQDLSGKFIKGTSSCAFLCACNKCNKTLKCTYLRD